MDEKEKQYPVFKTVAEFSSDWLMWLEDDQNLKYISPAAEEITGHAPQEFLDDPALLKRIVHPDDKERILNEFKSEMDNPKSRAMEFRILHKNGQTRWIAHRCRPVLDEQGKIIGRVSSNRDITEKKNAQRALSQKEKFLQAIFDGFPDPIHVIDREYKVLLTNQKLLEMKKATQQELYGQYCYQAYQGRNALCEQCAPKEVFATGQPHSLIKTLPLPDGNYRYFDVFAFPLFEENGEVKQVIEMTRDITDKEIAAREIKKLAAIIEQSADAIAITDKNFTIEYVNPAFEKMTAYNLLEINDLNRQRRESGQEMPAYAKDILATIHRGEIWRGEHEAQKKSGETYYLESIVFPLRANGGKTINYVKISRDISQRKTLEDALRAQEERLRTLINATPDIICFKDGQGRWLEANKADLQLFQLEKVDYRGKKDSELARYSNFYYDAFMACEASDEITWKKGAMSRGIEVIPKTDSTEKVFDLIKVPLFNEDGSRKGLIVIGRDITEMKQAEDALKENIKILSEERNLFRVGPVVVFKWKKGAGWPVEYVSPNVKQVFGYEAEEFLEAKISYAEIIHKDDIERVGKEVQKAKHSKVYQFSHQPYRIVRKDGKAIWLYDFTTIFRDASDNITHYLGYVIDVTEKMKAEQALRESENNLRSLFKAMQDVVFEMDENGRYIFIAPTSANLLYRPAQELLGKTVHEVFPEEQADLFLSFIRSCLNENKNQSIEYPLTIGEKTYWFEGRVTPKSARTVLFIARDISERKQAEEALKESENKYRTISRLYRLMADNMPDLIWAKDLKGRFLFVNKANIEVLLGAKDTDEPIGKDDMFFAERHRKSHPQRDDWFTFGELCINSDQVIIQNKIPQRFDEYGNVRGKFLYLDVYKAPLWDEQGKMIGTVGHGRIVTKEKEIEKKLKESEKRYRRIFEESQDVIFVSSIEGKFLDINSAGLQLFGYSSLEEIQQINIFTDLYLDSQDRKKYLQILKRQGFVKEYEIRLKKKDGAELTVVENSTAVYDAHKKLVACRGIMRDITEKKNLQAQLFQAQKMESIGTLAGGVAHDFNNLLTVINGYAEMALMHMDAGNPLHKDVLSILKAGKRAEALTSQLLAFSRKQIYKPEILNINRVITSMDKMLGRLIGEDIDIEKILVENLPDVKADITQLEQIFVNLVVNARDALRAVKRTAFHKKITIETGQAYQDNEYVVRHPGAGEGQYVFFAVSDNGIGMDEQTRQKVFEPFFTTKEKFKGTGLGLSTVYGIVKQNNGSIYVYSEPGQGTLFKIYWPITKEEKSTQEIKTKEENLHGNECILVVEDEEEVCRFASESLSLLGYTVFKAANGRLALELIKEKNLKMDLIVTDLIMPELNGKEFIEKVQESYSDIKVIYVSGYTENHIVHDGILEDGVHFIHKPYSVKDLAAAVRKVLDEK